ncbi:MAG: AraC family transcriptional regulator [Phycisphaerae bacterium]|nr:AraC family transcriptional regulator [Phycisphaerae bacterium]
MDFSVLNKLKIYSETKFRTPLRTEKQIGLWVDRIGENPLKKFQAAQGLRKLGQYAAVLIEKGRGFFISPSTGQIELNKGSVIILFPDEPSVYYPTGIWHEKYIVWNGPDAVRFEKLGFLSRRKIIIKDNIGVVSTAFEKLKKIITDEDKAAILERKNIITDMILELFRLSNPKNKKDEGLAEISAAVSWLAGNYAEEISISELAKRYNLSESYFRRYFRQHTGRSPREFIMSLRISRAKELLKQGLTVKEISLAVGYTDMFYFMRAFKKVAGTSCGRFRTN